MELSRWIKTAVESSSFRVTDSTSGGDCANEYQAIRNLLAAKTQAGNSVAILLPRSRQSVFAALACLELELTSIPLIVDWPETRTHELLDLCKPDFILSQTPGQRIELTRNPSMPRPESSPRLAYIMFTSGSTALPKGVCISRAALFNFFSWVKDEFPEVSAEDRLLNTAAFSFDLSVLDLALLITKRLELRVSAFDGDIFELLREIQESRISVMAAVPGVFQLALSPSVFARADLSSLKTLLVGGARFPLSLYRDLPRRLPKVAVYNMYGPTEATVYCTCSKPLMYQEDAEVRQSQVTVGTPIKGCSLRIRSEARWLDQPHQTGEICIGGSQLMEGYLGEKDSSHMTEDQGLCYYRSGDLGFFDESGEFFVLGRMDDTVKVSGHRINLSALDALIERSPLIETCATVAEPDELKGSTLVAYVKTTAPVSPDRLASDLSNFLAPHEIPRKFVFVESFPRTESGKISKQALRKH